MIKFLLKGDCKRYLWIKKKYFLLMCIFIFALTSIVLIACNVENAQSTPLEKVAPAILVQPSADNIQLGDSITASNLTGEFNVPGVLSFKNPDLIARNLGGMECEWIFEPVEEEKFNSLNGKIVVSVFEHRLSFEENGGFEIKDILFNDTYVLKEKPITAKNDYHFDGWSRNNNTDIYIDFPFVVNCSEKLYAGYRFHTTDKLVYGIQYDGDQSTEEFFATANWGNNGIIEEPEGLRPSDPPVVGSISGEVIVADMCNGMPVTALGSFSYTNITNIVFPNFLNNTGVYKQCRSLGPEIIIPKTVQSIDDEAFYNCVSLKSIKIEDGEGQIDLPYMAFYKSGLEKIEINRVEKICEWALAFTNIKEIVIPDTVTGIYRSAFAGSSLEDLTLIGDSLELVEGLAFNATPIKSIAFPYSTIISPDAFKGCTLLDEINISNEQINHIAQQLHTAYIGINSQFKVSIERSSDYGGDKYEGEYIANTETINLKFEKFSLKVLDALIHEFFHHYQYVLTYGVGDEDFYSVPIDVSKFTYPNTTNPFPYIIVENDKVMADDSNPKLGLYYEMVLKRCENFNNPYFFIDKQTLELWRQEYIQLLPDESNWAAYWNQVFEVDARAFAALFTGVLWE